MLDHATSETFGDKVIDAERPVLVEFWASWCGPCKMLAPVLDALGAEDHGFDVIKVDVDENPDLAAQYGAMTIPNMIVFSDGEAVGNLIGAVPKTKVLSFVEDSLRKETVDG